MTETLVGGIDGSPESRAAADRAAQEAVRRHAHLHLVHPRPRRAARPPAGLLRAAAQGRSPRCEGRGLFRGRVGAGGCPTNASTAPSCPSLPDPRAGPGGGNLC
ncbi:universal stress protein [Streptomyces virginiae]